jgi:hypothetical protein
MARVAGGVHQLVLPTLVANPLFDVREGSGTWHGRRASPVWGVVCVKERSLKALEFTREENAMAHSIQACVLDLREQTADHATGAILLHGLREILPEVAQLVPGHGRCWLSQRREANALLTAWPRR